MKYAIAVTSAGMPNGDVTTELLAAAQGMLIAEAKNTGGLEVVSGTHKSRFKLSTVHNSESAKATLCLAEAMFQ